MNRLSYILLTILLCISCSEENGFSIVTPESVITNTEETVYLGNGTTAEIEFTLFPQEYDLTGSKSAVTLEVVESNISYFQGNSPIFYTMAGIETVAAEKGKYKVKIRDLGKGEKYHDVVRLMIKTPSAEGTKTICSNEFTLEYAGNSISSIAFLRKDNPTALIKDFDLNLNSAFISITSPYITDSRLVLSYTTDAAKVLVGDVEQISGKTVNDFSSPVTYTFVSATGDKQSYTIQVKSSGLPVLVISTPAGKEIPPKTEDWLGETYLTLYNTDCSIDFTGKTSIRGRGNSTWKYPKKPYALKLDSKAEILGMPKHKRWVLLANWLDRTLLRNHISFRIAMQTDLDWTPHGEFVEVILNEKHIGNYYLCEHIKIDKNRVNIDDENEEAADRGYLMEVDSYYDEVFKFRSSRKNYPYMFKDPDEVNEEQFAFIQNYINNMEESLYDAGRFSSREYEDYMDLDSFIDWWIVHELTGSTETKHPKSVYMHKDKGGKLKAGPVWDFDWKTFRQNHVEWATREHIYYDILFTDPTFKARVKERWNRHVERLRQIPDFIESEALRIRNSEAINHQMWPVTQNTNEDIDLSFPDAVARMKKAYEDKLEFMDREISKM